MWIIRNNQQNRQISISVSRKEVSGSVIGNKSVADNITDFYGVVCVDLAGESSVVCRRKLNKSFNGF
jgi:hypothetical protein